MIIDPSNLCGSYNIIVIYFMYLGSVYLYDHECQVKQVKLEPFYRNIIA